ncbi:shikimate dehydrogenase [Limnobacter sp.]|uniref:shikimate dehydrogenase n=1 Tax=Limnobacter sp. TaxID=2003368 RepID=UPI003512C0ED
MTTLGATPPARFVVIGNPIAHSMSPAIHHDFAQQVGMPIQYMRLLAPLDGFEGTVRALQAAGVQGANVTVPFKLQAFELAQQLTDSASFAQAANTLHFKPDGLVMADNTDGGGLCRDLDRLLKPMNIGLSMCQVLMLGAGGAAAGCVAAFHAHGVQHLTVLNRTAAKARALAERAEALGLPAVGGSLDHLPSDFELPGAPLVVVNASSSSLHGEVPALHAHWWARAVLAYDMMYAPSATPFMQSASSNMAQGTAVADGLGMLVFQAQLAFESWTGRSPDALQTLSRVRASLQAKAR